MVTTFIFECLDEPSGIRNYTLHVNHKWANNNISYWHMSWIPRAVTKALMVRSEIQSDNSIFPVCSSTQFVF